MNSNEFYKSILNLPEVEQEKAISEFAKNNGVTKSVALKGFKTYQKELQRQEHRKRLERDNKAFQEMFKINNIHLPDNYTLKDGYICYQDDKTFLYLTKIFAITSRIYTKNNTFWTLERAKNKVEIIDSREFVKNDKIAYHFADKGEVLSPQKIQRVSHFISEFLRLNEHNIKHRRGLLKTGWNDGEFCLPSNSKYLFLNEELKERFGKVGTIDGQIKMLKELAQGKAFLLSLFSLASVFQGLLDLPLNYICHIGGLTGEGKSFSVKTAISLFGRKEAHHYGKNWNATINGLESYFEQMQDVPAWVDELESAKNLQEAVGALYIYSEGTGKARAYVDGFGEIRERETKNFRGHLFTTGEKSLWDVIQKVGQTKNRPLGLVRRSLDLDSVELWKGIDKEKVGKLLNNNQGHFITIFLEILKKEDVKKEFELIAKKYELNLDGKENLFYVLILTLNILRKNNIVTEKQYVKQINYIYDEIANSVKLLNTVQNSHIMFMEELSNYIANNRYKYRYLVDDSEIKSLEGRYKDGILSVATTVCSELCEKYGFVRKQVFAKLVKENILLNDTAKNVKIMKGANPKCFNFKIDLQMEIED